MFATNQNFEIWFFKAINVNRSLYGSSSRGRVQGGLAALAKLLAALDPTCTTIETPVYV